MKDETSIEVDLFLKSMETRKSIYTFLSAVYFNEVSLNFLERLRNQPVVLEGFLDVFVRSLKDADLEQIRTDLAAEYARVFLGMSRFPVSPYESVYTSDLHILMQDARDKVLKEYRTEGLAIKEGFNLPEDHISFEMDFMGYLCQKTIDSIKDGRKDDERNLLLRQRVFFFDHIQSWVPEFCVDVGKKVHTMFYQGVVQLTEAFVDSERGFLSRYSN
ncbi:MAG: molecular chaperone TorD family protein [Raoultibacter sp.]